MYFLLDNAKRKSVSALSSPSHLWAGSTSLFPGTTPRIDAVSLVLVGRLWASGGRLWASGVRPTW